MIKYLKIFSLIAIVAFLVTPATAIAKAHINFSLNLFEPLIPRPPSPPVIMSPLPIPPPYYYLHRPKPPRIIVKEYHYYHNRPHQADENGDSNYYFHAPQPR